MLECDLLGIEVGILVQQVNCMGAMGRGLALAIRKKWPSVYWAYRAHLPRLGQVQLIRVGRRLWVCNLAGQQNWGVHRVQTDLGAYRVAWPKVAEWALSRDVSVYAPWRFGCGLAGGDWAVVRPLIEQLCPVIWVYGGAWMDAENFRGARL